MVRAERISSRPKAPLRARSRANGRDSRFTATVSFYAANFKSDPTAVFLTEPPLVNSRGQSSKTVSADISDFIARATLRNISPEVRETAKLHLLDGLATMLGGANEKSSLLLRRRFRRQKLTGEATVLGSLTKFSAEHAALINGVQGHVLDYDDAQLATLPSRPMGQQTHPTTPVLAAALALAESRRATGAALLTAYIVGLEVACRLGDAVDPSHYLDGFHPTGTLGAFGATAAGAQLLKLSPRSIRHALGIAGTLASGLRANRGTMAKGLNAGRAAENGVIAATLAADGFTASENIFDDPMGFFSAACRGRVDADLLRFGKPFFVRRTRGSHQALPLRRGTPPHPRPDTELARKTQYRSEEHRSNSRRSRYQCRPASGLRKSAR